MKRKIRNFAMVAIPVLLLLIGAGLIVRHVTHRNPRPTAAARLPVANDHYLGVFERDDPGLVKVQQFSRSVGIKPNIILYYSGWGENFNTPFAKKVYRLGATPMVQIDAPGGVLSGIAVGQYDARLTRWANQVRSYGHSVIIGFDPEANGPWYTWGLHHQSPATWIAAWKHVVTLFRADGARNVTWLWTMVRSGQRAANPHAWWPGRHYVTWVGLDGYWYTHTSTFQNVFGTTIAQVRAFTNKPIFLSETSVGPQAGQVSKIPELIKGVESNHLLGFLWFDAPQHQGVFHQDWRLEDNPAAVAVFRQLMKTYK